MAVAWAMEVTGVDTMADRAVDELSGGELQRVWLATCLAQQTGVLLLDEPTTFLDLRYQMEILDLMRDLADDHDVAVGVVLHDLNQAAEVADQIVLLDRGALPPAVRPTRCSPAERLTETYGIRIDVRTDPDTGLVRTQPVGRHTHRSGTSTLTSEPAMPHLYRKGTAMTFRRTSVLLASLTTAAALALTACGTTETPVEPEAPKAKTEAAEPVTVTDARNKKVTLPEGPATRVVGTGVE